jgi:hypothetical protein
MYKVILFIASVLFSVGASAQTENAEVAEEKTLPPAETKLEASDSTRNLILQLKGRVSELEESEKQLKSQNVAKQQKINELNHKLASKEKYLIFADSIIARLSNDCLRKPYNDQQVQNALVYFSKMYSPELQKKFYNLKGLLENYGRYYNEVMAVIEKAKADNGFSNPFSGTQTAQSYISQLSATSYYKKCYNANWTIMYLNKVIDKSLKVLKAYDPKKKAIDFSWILE